MDSFAAWSERHDCSFTTVNSVETLTRCELEVVTTLFLLSDLVSV